MKQNCQKFHTLSISTKRPNYPHFLDIEMEIGKRFLLKQGLIAKKIKTYKTNFQKLHVLN